MRDPHIWY